MRARVSPMIVDLKCPTCISLAMLGDEKSSTALLTGRIGAHVLIPFTSISCILCNILLDKTIFTKPGPATDVDSIISDGGSEDHSNLSNCIGVLETCSRSFNS
ncbi:Os05g0163050 [Oryza sativa Japonica Group]|uniref:Os05g0163050 protein n=1 Tax=Oryza sativa subsp. japonica TaxID=39947 RepID=A0A0P0WID8_ORYSJ|nr:hypothetical protein EE612_027303 [Oryza sativa]BAS92418.1 Os05g0163050 [Oryza sativa Japonica Group]